MATLSIEQITDIIKNNPQKARVQKMRKLRKQLMKHIHGVQTKETLVRPDYFENEEVYKVRKADTISNKDMMARILQEEDQVFTTRGGSALYSLSPDDEKTMNELTSNVVFGLSLHNWVRNFALQARRADPGGLIFMEMEQTQFVDVNSGQYKEPKCYPTYKSTESIYDYLTNGRNIEYVCFQIMRQELATYGIKDPSLSVKTNEPQDTAKLDKTAYFRFVDDAQDVILKLEDDNVIVLGKDQIDQPNPIVNPWGRVPAFTASELLQFDDPLCFDSPISDLVELAESYLNDRSVLELVKKFHGFPKAVEPLLKCPTCDGSGQKGGNACPDCTLPGQSSGTGYKLHSKVSDVIKFPLELIAQEGRSFDFNKVLGYATLPVDAWQMQASSIDAREAQLYYTYWHCPTPMQMAQFNGQSKSGNPIDETATKTLTNLQPKYARLNHTADWAEQTIKMIADLIGEYWFENRWKGASISLSRNYILESVQDLADHYYTMRKNGAPDALKDEALERYIYALYQSNPVQQAKYLKLVKVLPFPHDDTSQVEASQFIPQIDKLRKRYGVEWAELQPDVYIIASDIKKLRDDLTKYVQDKMQMLEDDEKEEEGEQNSTDTPNNKAKMN